jgi:hypothetical protein
VAWLGAFVILAGQRVWNAIDGPLMRGWDDFGHVGYVLFLDLYGAVPWADQGWSYFHPPLHYVIGWGLAQFGSAEVLLRGLSLIGGAASLLIAWLAEDRFQSPINQRPEKPRWAIRSNSSSGISSSRVMGRSYRLDNWSSQTKVCLANRIKLGIQSESSLKRSDPST